MFFCSIFFPLNARGWGALRSEHFTAPNGKNGQSVARPVSPSLALRFEAISAFGIFCTGSV